MRFLILLILVGTLGARASAQPGSNLIKAQLLADVSSVKPGESFTAGVLLKIAPHYHVYWTNPGDSGQATSVQLKAFPNSNVEPMALPTPFRIEVPGGLVNYGYENEVMLLARVTPHVNPEADTDKLQLQADVSWLVCDENACIPGGTKLTLALPIAASSTPDNAELFKTWQQQIPRPLKNIDAQIDPPPSELKLELTLPGIADQALTKVEWFPDSNEPLIIKDIKVTPSANNIRVNARVELPAKEKLTRNTIDSVLGYTDSHGLRRGFSLSVPIKQ